MWDLSASVVESARDLAKQKFPTSAEPLSWVILSALINAAAIAAKVMGIPDDDVIRGMQISLDSAKRVRVQKQVLQ